MLRKIATYLRQHKIGRDVTWEKLATWAAQIEAHTCPDTLAAARACVIKDAEASGTPRCPCCSQIAKVYKRRLHSGMASRLILLSKLSTTEEPWVSVNTLYRGTRSISPKDFPYFRFWGFIEKNQDKLPKGGGRRNSLWRITDEGRDFVKGERLAHAYAKIYDNNVLSFSDEQVSIREALGTDFDYDQLMGYEDNPMLHQ